MIAQFCLCTKDISLLLEALYYLAVESTVNRLLVHTACFLRLYAMLVISMYLYVIGNAELNLFLCRCSCSSNKIMINNNNIYCCRFHFL